MRLSFLLRVFLSVALLTAGPVPFVLAQQQPEHTIVDFNGDTEPGAESSILFLNTNINPTNVYLAEDDNFQVQSAPLVSVSTGSQLIMRPQTDPILTWNLTLVNRTDLGPAFGQLPEAWSLITLTLTPPPGLAGQLYFLRDGEDPSDPNFETGSDRFQQFALSNDRLTLTFFDPDPQRGPVLPGDPQFIDSSVLLRFKLQAPVFPDFPGLPLDVHPNQPGALVIPEPGTLTLAGAALLPLLGRVARRRRAA